eukprot:scaffold203890_cov46-Prasinocladus_malaysianus.AAC.1
MEEKGARWNGTNFIVPHSERRRRWYAAKEKAEVQSEIDLVKGLDNFDPAAPPKRMEIDPDEEDPEEAATAAAAAQKAAMATTKGK